MPGLVIHEIPPVYDSRSRVLLLGSIPSPKSRESGFYYGHPQNRFWRVLARVLGEPLPEGAAAKRAMLLRRRVALWDVLQSCTIEGASDASIRDARPNDLSPIFAAADIRAVFTTGGKAYNLYQKYLYPATGRAAARLPSTSPANRAQSLDALCAAYGQILSYLED